MTSALPARRVATFDVIASNSAANVGGWSGLGAPSRGHRVDRHARRRRRRAVGDRYPVERYGRDVPLLPRGRHRRHQAGGRGRRRRRARCSCAIASPRRRATCGRRCRALDAAGGRRGADRRRSAAASAAAGPMDRRRRDGLAAEHPGLARLPAARPAGRAHRSCPSSSTTTPRRWPSARGGAAPAVGVRDFLGMVVSHRRRRRDRPRRPAARRAARQRRPHRPRHRRARRAAVRLRRRAAASRPRRRHRRSRPETGRPPQRAPLAIVERTGLLVGRAVASVARNLSTCASRSSPARSRSASASRSSPPPRTELDQRARLPFTERLPMIRPAGLGAAGAARRRGRAGAASAAC